MKVLKGTLFVLAQGTTVTLDEDTEISFPNSDVEDSQVGFLAVTNNLGPTPVQSSNGWPANDTLYPNHDPNGVPLKEIPEADLAAAEETESDSGADAPPLESMSKAELLDIADNLQLGLSGKETKAELITAIEEAQQA